MPSCRPLRAIFAGSQSAEFDQDIGRFRIAAGCFAADDAGDRFDAMVIGDDDDLFIEPIGAAVEGFQGFAGAGAAHADGAGDLLGIEDMQRPGAIEGEKIGDVDEAVDRPQPDREQPFSEPVGARPVVHTAHETQSEGRRKMRIRLGKIERDGDGAGELAGHGRNRRRDQAAEIRCGEIAGDSRNTHGIRPIGREINVDDGIVEPRPLRISDADRRILRQFDDAAMILGQFEFGGGTQHACGFNPANHALAEGDFFRRNVSAWRGENRLQPGARIGGAADDLDRRAGADVDKADPQPVGIGMRLGFDNGGDGEVLEQRRRIIDMLDLKADLRQRRDDGRKIRLGLEMLFEPGKREFHRRSNRSAKPRPFAADSESGFALYSMIASSGMAVTL